MKVRDILRKNTGEMITRYNVEKNLKVVCSEIIGKGKIKIRYSFRNSVRIGDTEEATVSRVGGWR